MHQNASKWYAECKCFVHEIIKEVVLIRFKRTKIKELLVSLCDGRPCILSKSIAIEIYTGIWLHETDGCQLLKSKHEFAILMFTVNS